MAVDVQKTKKLIDDLAAQVDKILIINDPPSIRREYQKWYSQVQQLIIRHLPNRSNELENLYYTKPTKHDSDADAWLYSGIRSYLRTTPDWDVEASFRRRFEADIEQQRGLLLAIPEVLQLQALTISALVTADLVEGELNEASLLLEHGFVRAAGAVAGVALEAHLKLLHDQANLTYTNKDTIIPLATRLRKADFITLGDEKKCIAMSETRNNCDHKNKSDPTTEEVRELIEDVKKFVKRVQVI